MDSSLFEHIKPFKKTEKGSNNYIGYGFRERNVNRGKRKAYRSIRKYGFDTSEIWNLDTTIMRYLSDNIGGFFRECGSPDDWGYYDLEGNSWGEAKFTATEHSYDNFVKAEELRVEAYKVKLKKFLESGSNEAYKAIHFFVLPRLLYFTQHHEGYPALDDFETDEQWTNTLKDMYGELAQNKSELFVKYFFNLWD